MSSERSSRVKLRDDASVSDVRTNKEDHKKTKEYIGSTSKRVCHLASQNDSVEDLVSKLDGKVQLQIPFEHLIAKRDYIIDDQYCLVLFSFLTLMPRFSFQKTRTLRDDMSWSVSLEEFYNSIKKLYYILIF